MKMYNFSLVLRIRCDAKMSQCPLGEKFGCNPETEAPQLIELAKSLDLNVCSVQCSQHSTRKPKSLLYFLQFSDDWN